MTMKPSTLGGHRWRHGLPSGSGAVRPVHLFREDEVVQAGAVEHGVVDAVAPEAAVAEDLPGLRAGEVRSTRARTCMCERLCSYFQAMTFGMPTQCFPRSRTAPRHRPDVGSGK